jgi:hypothetical protein
MGDPSKAPMLLACPLASNNMAATEVLLFGNDVSTLNAAQKNQLDAFAGRWHALGNPATVRIDGFASERGTEEHNWQLSCARAQAVQQELLTPSDPGVTGIPEASLQIFMHGETSEFQDEAQNRRVQLSIIPNTPSAPPGTPSAQPALPPKQPDNPVEGAPTLVSTTDCNMDQARLVDVAVGKAKSNIAAVLPPLIAKPLTEDMQNALWIYFRDSSDAMAARVAKALQDIAGMLNHIAYECEEDCTDKSLMGYVKLGTMMTGLGHIHLCMNNLKADDNDIVDTIIHEAAHFVLSSMDYGYYNTDCSETESTVSEGPSTKLETADSYNCLVKNWLTKTVVDRANAKGDLTGVNMEGIRQSPPGAIDLNGLPRHPLFTMNLTRGPLAMITGVSYRWVLRDDRDRSYQMTNSDGESLFEFKPAGVSVLAILNLPTRDLLKQRHITSGKVLCRATSPVFGDKLFEIRVTFIP